MVELLSYPPFQSVDDVERLVSRTFEIGEPFASVGIVQQRSNQIVDTVAGLASCL